jgi:anti-sigma B factor antagonist
MSEGTTPDFIVCADSDPVLVKINGKANYLNCSPINDFFDHVVQSNRFNFAIDFEHCLGMDSTFLGVLAGVATKALQQNPQGSILLANLSQQNKQLIRGLGLHHLPTVKMEDSVDVGDAIEGEHKKIHGLDVNEKEASPEMILEAHERLMKLNRANERRFQDVVRFLRREADKKSGEESEEE